MLGWFKYILDLVVGVLGVFIALNGSGLGVLVAIGALVSAVIGYVDDSRTAKEIERLKRQANPRTLKGFEGGEIAIAVQEFAGSKVEILIPAYSDEPNNFAKDLARALSTTDVNVKIRTPIVFDSNAPVSFEEEDRPPPLSISCGPKLKALAETLSKVFVDLDLADSVPIRDIDESNELEKSYAYGRTDVLFLWVYEK